MKLLLYCTKAKPYLYYAQESRTLMEIDNSFEGYKTTNKNVDDTLNGKIVAECDFEVEWCDTSWCCSDFIEHKGLEKSCLTKEQLFDYVKGKNEFYAIHIKNLHIFTSPKELSDFEYTTNSFDGMRLRAVLFQAPQNMQKIIANGTDAILISIKSQLLCKILNGEKTIEVRKKVLKEMLKYD